MGTIDVSNERLMSLANGLAKNGAPSLKNHAGRWSNPVDVDFSLSSILNTRSSDTSELATDDDVSFSGGVTYMLSVE